MKKATVLPIPVDSPAKVVSNMANDKLISIWSLNQPTSYLNRCSAC
jgi:hypothetical protein